MKPLLFKTAYPDNEPTYFRELIISGLVHLGLAELDEFNFNTMPPSAYPDDFNVSACKRFIATRQAKFHTIRAGSTYHAGQELDPRYWLGRPRRSFQKAFAPPVKIASVQGIEILNVPNGSRANEGTHLSIYIDGLMTRLEEPIGAALAKNDGLPIERFVQWFKQPVHFVGQIVCWHPGIDYKNYNPNLFNATIPLR